MHRLAGGTITELLFAHNKSHPVFFSSIYRMAFTVLPCALDDTSAFFVLFSYLILFFWKLLTFLVVRTFLS